MKTLTRIGIRPVSTRPSRASQILYGTFVLFCVVTVLVGHSLASRNVPNLRLFDWYSVGLVALGGLGIWLGPQTGFADLLDWRVSAYERWTLPLLIGLGFAVADIAVFKRVLHPEPITGLMPFMQPFPYSLLLFGSGALYTDCLYRLVPLPLLMWLIGRFLLRDERREQLFWALALLSSLVEPLEQLMPDTPALMAYSFGTGYTMNLLQAMLFRRYGFGAGLAVRLGHYALWHVGFGAWVEWIT
ncbi:hypothetical protein [Spirosoma rigui]|uniref:hypothetical protein n=1 Tax=Spirosoma rigui TaxID=564064 RepID=UPI0009AFB35E|nr:hypothetical protein [Spirosoma rigui]